MGGSEDERMVQSRHREEHSWREKYMDIYLGGDPRKHKEGVRQIRDGKQRAIKVNTKEQITIIGSQDQSLGDLLKSMWLALASELCQWRVGRLGYLSTLLSFRLRH